ncbi:MAG: hypothetical protein JO072_00145 [Parafilimonas sp.]|nr:hypothetical protein [Parafilimonas sp.]
MATQKRAKKAVGKSIKKSAKKSPKKSSKKTGKNKLGVKNSLVNNINAKKKKGTSHSKNKTTVSKENYKDMENKWGKRNKN